MIRSSEEALFSAKRDFLRLNFEPGSACRRGLCGVAQTLDPAAPTLGLEAPLTRWYYALG